LLDAGRWSARRGHGVVSESRRPGRVRARQREMAKINRPRLLGSTGVAVLFVFGHKSVSRRFTMPKIALEYGMHLLRLRLLKLGPFDQIDLNFEEDGEPRLATVIQGGGGIGKTTLLLALSSTRPGNSVVPHGYYVDNDEPGSTIGEFRLGLDDPERPHSLTVASPNARVFADEEREMLRRREQSLFDRVAREAGFVFVAIPATRWFSRQPIAITAPARGLARYDVRSPVALDDPTRGDLARETKQALAYAAISRAIAQKEEPKQRFERLARAMQHAVDSVLGLIGLRWVGVDPLTWEPIFCADGAASGISDGGDDVAVAFDALPNRARHLIAFVALPIRALWAAYPLRDPLAAEGIVTIDEIELYQDSAVLSRLVPTLRLALPQVQWIVTTTSPIVATSCEINEVIALRRATPQAAVLPYTGEVARTH
ncbi:MAG TPA: hypothetical protein VIV60_10605, partial [Polyangiaceae bacterium]